MTRRERTTEVRHQEERGKKRERGGDKEVRGEERGDRRDQEVGVHAKPKPSPGHRRQLPHVAKKKLR